MGKPVIAALVLGAAIVIAAWLVAPPRYAGTPNMGTGAIYVLDTRSGAMWLCFKVCLQVRP